MKDDMNVIEEAYLKCINKSIVSEENVLKKIGSKISNAVDKVTGAVGDVADNMGKGILKKSGSNLAFFNYLKKLPNDAKIVVGMFAKNNKEEVKNLKEAATKKGFDILIKLDENGREANKYRRTYAVGKQPYVIRISTTKAKYEELKDFLNDQYDGLNNAKDFFRYFELNRRTITEFEKVFFDESYDSQFMN